MKEAMEPVMKASYDTETHNTSLPDDQDDTPKDLPPAYSDRPTFSTAPPSHGRDLPSTVADLPQVEFSYYVIPESTISDNQTTTTTTCQVFYLDPKALIRLVNKQSALPPKPIVHIKGHHYDYGPEYGDKPKIDFDLYLNIMPLLLRDGSDRWDYISVTQASNGFVDINEKKGFQKDINGGLEEWTRRFCDDHAEHKQFTLERKVTNWDIEYLEGRIRSLVASTRYIGTLTVDFPIAYSKVVVRKGKDESSGSSLLGKLIPGKNKKPDLNIKRYDVVQSVWPYATAPPGGKTRDCAKMSEQDWWEAWKSPIRNSILAKKRGWVTGEDRMEAAMGLDLPVKKDWGSGNEWSWN